MSPIPSVLSDLAGDFGADRARFAQVFDADSTYARTREDFEEARAYGVGGFPTLLLRHGGQVAVVARGYTPWEDLEPHLRRWLEERYGASGSRLVRDVDGLR